MTTPRNVDALVVNWQTAHLLDGCLRSLIAQRGVRVRLVVVDNGSSDGSTDLVAERFPDACLIRLPENVGYTRATNAGLRHCTASYVLLCNPDCTPDPDAVAILADRLERTVDAAAAAPKMIGTEGEPQGFVFRFPTLWDAVFCYTETGQHLDRRTGRHNVPWDDPRVAHLWSTREPRVCCSGATSSVTGWTRASPFSSATLNSAGGCAR